MEAFIPRKDAKGFILPNFIFEDQELNCGAKLLFSVLCDYARDKSYCYPTKKTLAKRLNVSLNTLKTWLNQLIERGYVRTQETSRGLTFFLYCPKKFTAPMSNSDEEVSKIDTEIKVKNLNILTPPISPKESKNDIAPKEENLGSVDLSFEKFWEVYPRKENKEKARKVFHKIFDDLPSLEVFRQAIANFSLSEQWQKEEGRFIPYFQNFLADKRWQEIQVKPQQEIVRKVYTIKIPSFEEAEKERREYKLKKEQEEQTRQMLSEEWKKFSANFKMDSSFNRFTAQRNFYKHYHAKGEILQATSHLHMTAFEYFEELAKVQS